MVAIRSALRWSLLICSFILAFGKSQSTTASTGGRTDDISEQVGREYVVDVLCANQPGNMTCFQTNWKFSQPGSSYLSLHFAWIKLDADVLLEISDLSASRQHVLQGRYGQPLIYRDFWAPHVPGDALVLRLGRALDDRTASSPSWADGRLQLAAGRGFAVDKYAAGTAALATASCGQRGQNVQCLAEPYLTAAAPVARLLVSGIFACTGFLVSPRRGGIVLTNEHCVGSQLQALNTDVEFGAEAPGCELSNCRLCYPGSRIFSGVRLAYSSKELDVAVLELGDPDYDSRPESTDNNNDDNNKSSSVVAEFGWLPLLQDGSTGWAQAGTVVVPQHPLAKAKELAFGTLAGFASSCQHMNSPSDRGTTASTHSSYDVAYWLDTASGSSGSPVLSARTLQVLALHHCGSICPALGVPMHLVWPQIRFVMEQACTLDADCLPAGPADSCLRAVCRQGLCSYQPDCDDADPCTEDVCVAAKHCWHWPLPDCAGPASPVVSRATRNATESYPVLRAFRNKRYAKTKLSVLPGAGGQLLQDQRYSIPARALPVCGDGSCNGYESCRTCAKDCPSDAAAMPVSDDTPLCGDGVCQLPHETCLSCAKDCAASVDSTGAGSFCCGYGLGFLSCLDPRCKAGQWQCTALLRADAAVPFHSNQEQDVFCCGDGICARPMESCGNCPIDCAEPEKCWDGLDNDCNGLVDVCDGDPACPPAAEREFRCHDLLDDDCDGLLDCEDPDCAFQWPCQCKPQGAACQLDGQCCNQQCRHFRCR